MIALVDWAYDKSSEQGRILERQSAANFSFRDLAEKIRMTEADKRAIEAFEPWESLGPFNESLDKDSPEFAIVDFLTSWRNRNYGKMAERAVNLMQLSITNDAQPDNRDEAATEKLKVPTFWSTYSDPPSGVLLWPPKHRRIGANGQGVVLPHEVQQNIDMESYRVQETGSGKIDLERKTGTLDPIGTKDAHGHVPEEIETLSRIIAELNEPLPCCSTEEPR